MADGARAFASSVGATAHVFVAALADDLELSGDDGHHLARVRRVREGEVITAADGSGAWRAYAVRAARSGTLTMDAVGSRHVEPLLAPPITIAFALTKGDGPERVVSACTELGADALVPLLTDRCVVPAASARRDVFAARLGRVARAAAMQSRRARIPSIEPVTTFDEIVTRPDLVLAAPDGDPAPPAENGTGWCAVVGPEGGFSDAELRRCTAVPRLGVGPHGLRATTAATAVAAVLAVHRARPSW